MEKIKQQSIDKNSQKKVEKELRKKMGKETASALEAGKFPLAGGKFLSLVEDRDRLRRETTVILAEENLPLPDPTKGPSQLCLEFLNLTTLGACSRTRGPNSTLGALSFASAKRLGGGFLRGDHAQEESIARTSTLYASLTTPAAKERYYVHHKVKKPRDGMYSHAIIVSPSVLIFRDETTGDPLPEPYKVTIVSCPAVNAGHVRRLSGQGEATEQRIRETMKVRIKRILAAFQRLQVGVVVLGAYGCGILENRMGDVARLFRLVLEEHGWQFQRVVFAVPDGPKLLDFKSEFVGSTRFTFKGG